VRRNTIINTGNRYLRLSTIRQKLDDKHAEVLGRVLNAALADNVSVHPRSNDPSSDCLVAREVPLNLLRVVRSLYAQFGLMPPQLSPELQEELESL
jgi:hypothetical protein